MKNTIQEIEKNLKKGQFIQSKSSQELRGGNHAGVVTGFIVDDTIDGI